MKNNKLIYYARALVLLPGNRDLEYFSILGAHESQIRKFKYTYIIYKS